MDGTVLLFDLFHRIFSNLEFYFSPVFLLTLFSLSALHTCAPTDFTCNNGRCIQYRFRCDHYDNCQDNSDEEGCLFPSCNATSEFTCLNGKCIPQHLVCNGVNNCHDNETSDEKNCRKFIYVLLCIGI